MFLEEPQVVTDGVLEPREVVDTLERQSDAGDRAGQKHSHGYENFGDVGYRRTTALAVLSQLTFPFLDVDEDLSDSPRGRWVHDRIVSSVPSGLTPRSDQNYDSRPCVKSVARLDVVEGDLLLAMETQVKVFPKSER